MPPEEASAGPFQLQARDLAILDHVRRYRITTPAALWQTFFPARLPNAVTKVTTRLAEAGFLTSYPLYHRHTYFVLGPRAEGGTSRPGAPLQLLALAKAFGTLAFCCQSDQPRRRLNAEEMGSLCQLLGIRPFAPHLDFYLDEASAGVRLNWIRVDFGAEPRRLITHCRRRIAGWTEDPGFARVVHATRFGLTLVTGEARKRKVLADALERDPIPGIGVNVVQVRALGQLIIYGPRSVQ